MFCFASVSLYRGTVFGIPAIRNSLKNHPELKELLDRHVGNNLIYGLALADMFYVPRKFAASFAKYSPMFWNYGVHTEIAVHSIIVLAAADHESACCSIEWLSMYWDGPRQDIIGTVRATVAQQNWASYHPMKMAENKCFREIAENMYRDCF